MSLQVEPMQRALDELGIAAWVTGIFCKYSGCPVLFFQTKLVTLFGKLPRFPRFLLFESARNIRTRNCKCYGKESLFVLCFALVFFTKDSNSWKAGRRRSQGGHRLHLRLIEIDPADGRIKLNPLANWDQVRETFNFFE